MTDVHEAGGGTSRFVFSGFGASGRQYHAGEYLHISTRHFFLIFILRV